MSHSSTTHVVGLSGGKDSGVVGALAKARQDRTGMAVRYINSDTGNEAPWHRDHLEAYGQALGITIEFITQNFDDAIARRRERLPVQWAENGVPQHLIDHALEMMHPTGVPYLDLVLSKGMFAAGVRRKFCTEELKIRPAEEQIVKPILNAGGNVVQWYGIRADESKKRADGDVHPRFGRIRTYKVAGWGWTIEHRPILSWTVEMVVAAHKHFGIPMNPAYSAGFSRYGCFPCINERKAGMAIIARRYPEEVERIAEWERRVTACNVSWKKPENFARRDPATFFPAGTVPRLERNDIRDVASWSLHARGNRQADMLAGYVPDQQFYACTGGTGWCESA